VSAWRGWVVFAGSAVSSTACGGGAPLLHPAHTLPADQISAAVGTSGHFVLGDLARAKADLTAAAADPGGATTRDERHRFVQGALAELAMAPGVAPYVAARAGLGNHNEVGLTYTARSLRLDARHAFEWPSLAVSVGLAGIGALPRVVDRPKDGLDEAGGAGLRTMDVESSRGYGLELPLLFGYRSSADVVKLWAGLRAGFERDSYYVTIVEAPDHAFATDAEATRLWAGGLVGFSVGLAPIEVRVELDAAYEMAEGSLAAAGGKLEAELSGWTLTPAMAISAKF
jgi:hypothetical protein